MLKGRTTAIIAGMLLTGFLSVQVAQADELGMQHSAFNAAEFHRFLINETPKLPSSSINPATPSLEAVPDVNALQPLSLDLRPVESSGRVDTDPSQRVPEPRSLPLFVSGLILFGFALRWRNPQLGRTRPFLVSATSLQVLSVGQ